MKTKQQIFEDKVRKIVKEELMSDKETDMDVNSGGKMTITQTPSNYFVIEYKGIKISLTTDQAKKLARVLNSRYE